MPQRLARGIQPFLRRIDRVGEDLLARLEILRLGIPLVAVRVERQLAGVQLGGQPLQLHRLVVGGFA